ncbi:acyltransferase [Mycobacterium sp. CBMA226]|nr:acyltransferase [Mycolicibacterium sp. CBMA 226]
MPVVEPTSTAVFGTSNAGPTTSSYRRDIDALRAIAVVAVVAFHAGVPGFAGGFAGVDIFFVISGFVILRGLTAEQGRAGSVGWWAFYGRRFRRLAPAALLMIVVVILLGMLVFNPVGEQQAVAKSGIAAATSTSNFYFSLFLGDYFVPTYLPNVFLHTWSLAVEEQFYLGVPLLFVVTGYLVRRLGRDWRRVMIVLILLVCAASLVSAVVLGRFAPTQTFYLPFGRAYELGIGALLAVVRPPAGSAVVRRAAWLISAGALVGVIVLGLPVYGFPGAWALIPTVATAGMIWAHVTADDPGGRYLLSAPVVGIGKLSYGWYLWHWPLLSIIATWYLREPPVWLRVMVVGFALVLAGASYRYWEPRFRAPAGRRTVLTGLVAIAATCALALGSELFADQLAKADNWPAVAHAKHDTAFPAECIHDTALVQKPEYEVCPLPGFDPARPSVVVWGDSYAQALLPGVVKAVHGRPINVVAMARGTCPPYLPRAAKLPDIPYGLERTRLELCEQHNNVALQWILDAVKARRDVRVIIAARWPIYLGQRELFPSLAHESQVLAADSESLVTAGTPALLARLDQAQVGVDLVGVSPELERPGPECETRRWRTFTCDVPMSVERQYWGGVPEWFHKLHAELGDRSRVIDPAKVICDEFLCRAQSGGVLNFYDTDHLSAAAAEKLSDQISPTVDALLGQP